MRFADVYLPVPVEGPFTYSIPENMNVVPGVRVVVPFGKRSETGFVARVHGTRPGGFAVKEIVSVSDDGAVFGDTLLSLCRRVSSDYVCSTGEVLSAALPSSTKSGTRGDGFDISPESSAEIILSEEQTAAFGEIVASRDEKKSHLLYGVTGSGKTEVYISLVSKVLAEGGSAIILVPEISLSAQLFERFSRFFGRELVLYHSGLSPNQRLLSWKKFLSGEARVAVGTRSAVFMQCPSLGAIVIDEEHDGSYKEHSTPRYNARRIAMYRSKGESAFLLLGSATPSIESLYAARSGVMGLSRLTNRYGGAKIPPVVIVGMEGKRDDDLFSTELKIATKRAVDAGRQAILLLNRRGFSPIVFCRSCKKKMECPDCSISMNYHGTDELICHYCGHTRPMPSECPSCASEDIVKLGSGTQRVESMIEKTFHGKRIFRLDQDSARKKDSAKELIEKMRDGQIDILVGTQMVAKGFDFKKVDVVGVILADIGMNLPDFRASERIFSLLSQVAGRCGRGDNPGKVIVQTLDPANELLRLMAESDYDAFYEKELSMRKMLSYPPFSRIARFLVRGTDEAKVTEGVDRVAAIVRKRAKGLPAVILGPSPAPLSKIGGNFRHHLIVKSRDSAHLREIARAAYEKYGRSDPYLEIDIDPFDML